MSSSTRAPYKKSTVNDVALRAGVSHSAVSHFINGRVKVCSQETAARIDRAIAELHFTPARALHQQRTRATNTLGVCAPLPSEEPSDAENTYLKRLWSGLGGVVDQHSYRVLHFPRSIRNGTSCSPFLDGSIDGLLITTHCEDSRPATLCDAGLPTVCVNRSTNLPPNCGSVVANEEDVVRLAMSHLWELGHRRIAYLGPSIGQEPVIGTAPGAIVDVAIMRHGHYTQWMERAGMGGLELALLYSRFDYMSPDEALQTVDHWINLAAPPTAVFCANDRFAVSAACAFAERGWRIPEDISLVGVDNEGTGATSDPALTSVDVPVAKIGRQATSMLIDIVNGRAEPQHLLIPVCELVVRSSTSKPRTK